MVAGSVVRVIADGRGCGLLALLGDVLPVIDQTGRDTGERIAYAHLFVIDGRDGARVFTQAPLPVTAEDIESAQ